MGVECIHHLCCFKLGDWASRRDIPCYVQTWLVGLSPLFMPSSLLTNLRQWTYWIAAIVAAVITLLAVFMKESRASKLLEIGMRKVAKGRKDR
jgi:hypothetical protein